MKVVLDTNVLLVSIPSQSLYHPVFKAFLDEAYTLCVTTDILDEYAEIFGERANKVVAQNTLETIDSAPNVEFVTKYYHWYLIKADPDDRNAGPQQVHGLRCCWKRGLSCYQ